MWNIFPFMFSTEEFLFFTVINSILLCFTGCFIQDFLMDMAKEGQGVVLSVGIAICNHMLCLLKPCITSYPREARKDTQISCGPEKPLRV